MSDQQISPEDAIHAAIDRWNEERTAEWARYVAENPEDAIHAAIDRWNEERTAEWARYIAENPDEEAEYLDLDLWSDLCVLAPDPDEIKINWKEEGF